MRRWLLPTAIVGILASALAVWSFWPSGDADSTGAALRTSFPAQAVGKPLTADEIENALTRADNYLATGTKPESESAGRHLVYPEGDNALFLYQSVLAVQPGNLRAKQGLAAMVSFYRLYSNAACKKEQWGNCAVIAGLGLRIDPSDDVLVRLKGAAEAGQRGERPTLPAE